MVLIGVFTTEVIQERQACDVDGIWQYSGCPVRDGTEPHWRQNPLANVFG